MLYSSKAAALKAARHARQLLNKPKGWKPCVWQNGSSWHYSLDNGPISLHTAGRDDSSFFALLSDDMGQHAHAGCSQWTDTFHHANPNRVIAKQVKLAKPMLAEYKRIDAFLDTL